MTSYLTKQKKNSRMNYKKKTLSKKKTFRKKNRKNTKRNRRKVNKSIKSIKYGGTEANSTALEDLLRTSTDQDTITIEVITEDSILELNVNITDDIHNSVKNALGIRPTKQINIFFGDIEIDNLTNFQENRIEDGGRLNVTIDNSLCENRWENYDIPFTEYIRIILGISYRLSVSIARQLATANNVQLTGFLYRSNVLPTILQNLTNLTGLDGRNETLCDVHTKLLQHNILLPSDRKIHLINKLGELFDYYDPSAVNKRGEDEDEANRLLEEKEIRINRELAELEEKEE